ncbi:uncharacterized protein EDB91DRAFT_1083758 [Suillus paluster]|uniref:uncharacterized protein n=1 Tax=Suillus paluster TaxID=48578 RepID=UPI001B86430E|nr:uncharacterized protein EDB91DRAFT_1083758 [Suillus paluster]KAG1735305.1 hypothetical protein EDB91DRAFT_1083758 [Suillus paluster]
MTESSQLINQQTAPVPHLVPPESMPPHPPQSFDAMLPQHQHYDAYTQPDSQNTQESASPLLHEGGSMNPFALTHPITAVVHPFTLSSQEMSVIPQKCSESVLPTLIEFSLTPSTALMTPNSLRSSSVAPPTSAGDKQIAATLTQTEPIAGAQVAIPKWLMDTITQLEHELKSQKQKLEEAGDIIHEQVEELVELPHQVTILHDAQNQLEDESLSSNVDVVKKTLQSSTKSSKSKAAQAISDNSKDNIWNSGVHKCFLKAIGITKPSAIREYHPHVNGSQIDGDQTIAVQISLHCQLEGQKERLTQGWHEGKHENECSISVKKLDKQISIRDKSNLKTPEWDFAFTLPYQSSDESMQSGDDDRGGIDPDTEEEKDVRKKPDTKSNLKDMVETLDLPDVKTSPRIPIELIDWEWLRARPQDPTRYNGTINDDQVMVPVPEQDANHWHAEAKDNFEAELADDEGELGFDEE